MSIHLYMLSPLYFRLGFHTSRPNINKLPTAGHGVPKRLERLKLFSIKPGLFAFRAKPDRASKKYSSTLHRQHINKWAFGAAAGSYGSGIARLIFFAFQVSVKIHRNISNQHPAHFRNVQLFVFNLY